MGNLLHVNYPKRLKENKEIHLVVKANLPGAKISGETTCFPFTAKSGRNISFENKDKGHGILSPEATVRAYG